MFNNPWRFYRRVLFWTVPFWILGGLAAGSSLPIMGGLPLSAFMALVPASVVLLAGGRTGRRALLGRLRPARLSRWHAMAALALPAAILSTYYVTRLLGAPLPALHVPWGALPWVIPLFLLSGLAEELGFMPAGYDPGRQRWGRVGATTVLGTFWGLWHMIPLLQLGRSAEYISLYLIATFLARVLIVVVYERSGDDLWTAILGHASANTVQATMPDIGAPPAQAVLAAGYLVFISALLAVRQPGVVSGPAQDSFRDPLF